MNPEELLDEQIQYYRARAPEYDQWWLREGEYDLGEKFNARWAAEIDILLAALSDFAPAGDVLELAGGTGIWTQQLVRWADRLTVVDTAPETLALNRARVSGAGTPIDYVEADLFAWRPTRRYDVVFFSFWLTHVPPARFEDFWSLVSGCLAPSGRFFVIDNARPFEDLGEDFPKLWVEEGRIRTPWSSTDIGAGVSERRVADGRTFNVVKLFYDPADLEARLAGLGWSSTFAMTDTFFLYGWGARS